MADEPTRNPPVIPPALFIARLVEGGNPRTTQLGIVVRSLTSLPFAGSRPQVEQLLEDFALVDDRQPRGAERFRPVGWAVRELRPAEWREVRDLLLADLEALERAGEDPATVARERALVEQLDTATAAGVVGGRLPAGVGEAPAWRWLTRRVDLELDDPGVPGDLADLRRSAWWVTWA